VSFFLANIIGLEKEFELRQIAPHCSKSAANFSISFCADADNGTS